MNLPAGRSFVDCDPVPLALEWLGSRPRVLEEFGGPEHVSGLREAPFPHLTVAAGGETTFGRPIDPLDADVAFEVWGDPDGRHGPGLLRRLAVLVCEEMRELLNADHVPGQPVVSQVKITRGPHPENQTNGQRRWTFTVSLRMTPPTE